MAKESLLQKHGFKGPLICSVEGAQLHQGAFENQYTLYTQRVACSDDMWE